MPRLFKSILAIMALVSVMAFDYAQSTIHPVDRTSGYKVIPEYERTMKGVLLAIDRESRIALHLEALGRFPKYTRFVILTSEALAPKVARTLKAQSMTDRASIVTYHAENLRQRNIYSVFPDKDKLVKIGPVEDHMEPWGFIWAQDLFEPISGPGVETSLLASDVYRWFYSMDGEGADKVRADNHVLSTVSLPDMPVQRLPITFKGGNILFDEIDGSRIAFIGSDVIGMTRTVWKATRERVPSEAEIVRIIKDAFHVDRAIVLGRGQPQPEELFHLDQAMVMLSKGVVAVTEIVGDIDPDDRDYARVAEARVFLSGVRKELRSLGYRLIPLEITIDNLRSSQFYVNGLPYKDPATGHYGYYIPVFEGSGGEADGGLAKANIGRLKEVGYKVTAIESSAYKLDGGLHCLYNVMN